VNYKHARPLKKNSLKSEWHFHRVYGVRNQINICKAFLAESGTLLHIFLNFILFVCWKVGEQYTMAITRQRVTCFLIAALQIEALGLPTMLIPVTFFFLKAETCQFFQSGSHMSVCLHQKNSTSICDSFYVYPPMLTNSVL